MTTSNPVSPKLIAAGIGSAVLPLLVTVVSGLVDLVLAGNIKLQEPAQTYVYWIAGILGAVLGAYLKKDGLRLPTLEPGAVAKVPNSDQLLHEAAQQLPEPDPLP